MIVVQDSADSRVFWEYRMADLIKTEGPYALLEKNKLDSYWLHCLPFCEGPGRPGRKLEEFVASM